MRHVLFLALLPTLEGCASARRPMVPAFRHPSPFATTAPVASPDQAVHSIDQETRSPTPPEGPPRNWFGRTIDTVAADHLAFYDQGSLLALGAGVGFAALSANSQLDRDIYEDVLPEWRTGRVNRFRDDVLWLGDGAVMLPVFGVTALLAPAVGSDAVGEWGERALRTTLVGAPSVLALQRLTGAGRPDDPSNDQASEWQPFEFSNGVSGHAFVGAIPFLTVAAMQDDPWIDGLSYVASTAVAAARLQGSRHYFSQVVLGWWIAFLATEAVDDSARGAAPSTMSILPYAGPDRVGFEVVHRF